MKVLVSEPVSEEGIAPIRDRFLVDLRPDLSRNEFLSRLPEYDGLIVRSATKVDREAIEAGKNLKVIGRAGVGVDNIDVPAATARGIIVVNAPSGNTVAAAEHTLGLMLALARHLPQAAASMRSGRWDRKSYLGVELYGKTLAVVGMGRIGTEVARRALAFGMEVLAYDPYLSPERAKNAGVENVPLEVIWERADFLTLHIPKGSLSIGAAELAKMKNGVRIVNCARGGIIDEDALYSALREGRVAGAALDVFAVEPPGDNPLLVLPNVIATPHLGASTEEAQVSVAVVVAEQVAKALTGQPVTTAVNLPPVPPEDLGAMAPYFPLAELVGRFCAQAFPGPFPRVEVRYRGEVAGRSTVILTNLLLKGLLEPMVDEPVTQINSSAIAQSRGIVVVESQVRGEDDDGGITLEGPEGVRVGAVLTSGGIRLRDVEGFRVDIAPSPYMLLCHHIDKPGIIGRTGTVLGEDGINIAGMQVGRERIGGESVMLMQLDDRVATSTLRRIVEVAGIVSARPIDLTGLVGEG